MLFRNVKLLALGLVLFLMVATTASSGNRTVADVPELPAPDGSSDTPEIEVVMIDGKKMKLSSLRGKVCVIDMFSSWCPHCQDHAPHMVKVYNQFKAQGFVIVSLAFDPKDKAVEVKKFIKDYGLNYPVGFMTNEVKAYFMDSHNHSVPQVVLFGKNGKMMQRWIGWTEESTNKLISLVDEELKTAAPNTASTTATPEAKPETKSVAAAATKSDAGVKPSAAKAPARRKK